MKKFILILLKDGLSKEECVDIIKVLTPICDSKFMKFVHNKGSVVIHFETEVDQFEVVPFIQGVLFGIITSFILTEITDKLSLQMPKSVLEHLLDLENESDGSITFKVHEDQISFEEEIDEEDYISLLIEDIKWKIKRPSLDQILEKIKKTGIKSLSEFEKETLEEYSKN